MKEKNALEEMLRQENRIEDLPVPAEGIDVETDAYNRQYDPLGDEDSGKRHSSTNWRHFPVFGRAKNHLRTGYLILDT